MEEQFGVDPNTQRVPLVFKTKTEAAPLIYSIKY